MEKLSHEKLDVYNLSIELLAVLNAVVNRLPTGYAYIADQLKRATFSIPLNIAEGAGKRTPKDKKKFYTIARGSALESGAIIDSCVALELFDSQDLNQAKILLLRIVAMLSKMSA